MRDLFFKLLMAALGQLMIPAVSLAGAPACRDVFKSEVATTDFAENFKVLLEEYKASEKARRDKSMDYNLASARMRQAELDMGRLLLRSQGVETWPIEENNGGFRILPKGDAPLSRLAKSLHAYGITAYFAPSLVAKGTAGGFGNRELYLDLQTLLTGRASSIMAHELRHMTGYLRSQKPEGEFERLFQTQISASYRSSMVIPGIQKPGPYRESYSLDEIPAHRQSAMNFLRALKTKLRQGQDIAPEQRWLKTHAGRFRDFVEGWKASADIFRHEVLENAFKSDVYETSSPDMRNLVIQITPVTGMIRKFFRKTPQDPADVGFLLRFVVTAREAEELRTKADVQRFVLAKIETISAMMQKIEPAVSELEKAFEGFDPNDLAALESRISALSRALADIRKSP